MRTLETPLPGMLVLEPRVFEDDRGHFFEVWNRRRYGRALDILVTHSPPFGIHDNKDLAHTGFRVFGALMRYFRPRYLLHGHVHIYRTDIPRATEYYDTTVLNVYPLHVFEYSDE